MQNNKTLVNEIFLLGFQNLNNFKIPMFCIFLLIYISTVWENVLIIVLVSTSQYLQSPMYFFLRQLSFSDLLQTASVVPIMLYTVINSGVNISLIGCIVQFYFFSGSEAFQCLLLTVMSYDRYLAICRPLHYTSMMNQDISLKFILVSWVLGFSIVLITVNIIGNLQFCEQHTIDHFFCDLTPLLELSCSDTYIARIVITLLSIPVIISPFIVIAVSYVYIVHSVLQITSSIGRQKAFSTCSSHLAVVSMFYGTLIGIYVVPPRKYLQTTSKVLSLLYTVVIPLVNPIIYSLRSKDMKSAFQNTVKKLTGGYSTTFQSHESR